jgi:hypothetical protein
LEVAQTKFKGESIQLDDQNNEIRKKLRALTVSMQSTERDRDWLLKKLRLAKKKYQKLETEYEFERNKISLASNSIDSSGFNSVFHEVSQDSSIFREISKLKDKQLQARGPNTLTPISRTGPPAPKPVTWRGRLAAEVAINRTDPLTHTEPAGSLKKGPSEMGPIKKNTLSSSTPNLSRLGLGLKLRVKFRVRD